MMLVRVLVVFVLGVFVFSHACFKITHSLLSDKSRKLAQMG